MHASGHPLGLDRATTGDYSPEGDHREEGTVLIALRILLTAIGFPDEAVDLHTRGHELLPADLRAAKLATAWIPEN